MSPFLRRSVNLDVIARQVVDWGGQLGPGGERGTTYEAFCVPLILHVVGELEQASRKQRRSWLETINDLQQPDGTYAQAGTVRHSDWHAMCMGCMATRVLGGRARYPYVKLRAISEVDALRLWLARRDWYDQWLGSREVWGACMLMLGAAQTPASWRCALHQWLDDEQDPISGMWRKGIRTADRYQAVAGAFHLLALYQMADWPVLHHEKIIDSILGVQKRHGESKGLFSSYDRPHFGELHAVTVLDWLVRVKRYRLSDVIRALGGLARQVNAHVKSRESGAWRPGDAHGLLAEVRLLAVMQQALPQVFVSQRPWRELWSDGQLYRCRY